RARISLPRLEKRPRFDDRGHARAAAAQRSRHDRLDERAGRTSGEGDRPVSPALAAGNRELRLMFGWAALWIGLIAICGAAWLYSSVIVWSVVRPLLACTAIIAAFLGYIRRIEGR